MLNDLKLAALLAYKTIAKGHRASTLLTVFVMALVFVDLIFISSILRGALGAIDEQLRVNFVSDVVVEPQRDPVLKRYIDDADMVETAIRQLPGVADISSRYKSSAVVSYDARDDGHALYVPAEVIGIDPTTEKSFSGVASSMIAGSYLTDDPGSDDIILGVNLSGGPLAWSTFDNLGGVDVGRKVHVAWSDGVVQEYTVRGIFQTKFPFTDQTAFVTKREAESALGTWQQASQLLVKLDDPARTPEFVTKIKALFPYLVVRPWTDYLGVFGEVTDTFDIVIGIVSGIGLLAAAFIIFILMFISVSSKRRQIGILRAIGVRRRVVIWSYVMQAAFYAVGGVALGTAAAVFGLAPYFAAHPLQVPVGSIGLDLNGTRFLTDSLLLVASALVAGTIPPWIAAEKDIIEAIWGA